MIKRHRKLVAAFVFGMSCVALYPSEFHLVPVDKVEEPSPQVRVDCGFLVGLYPALCTPAFRPALFYSINDIRIDISEGEADSSAEDTPPAPAPAATPVAAQPVAVTNATVDGFIDIPWQQYAPLHAGVSIFHNNKIAVTRKLTANTRDF